MLAKTCPRDWGNSNSTVWERRNIVRDGHHHVSRGHEFQLSHRSRPEQCAPSSATWNGGMISAMARPQASAIMR